MMCCVLDLCKLNAIESKVRVKYTKAHDMYQSKKYKAARVRGELESVLREFSGTVLHPNHEIFFNTYLPLINCCHAQKVRYVIVGGDYVCLLYIHYC